MALAGLSRPDVWTGIALNRNPNDPNIPPVWTAVESARTQLEHVGEDVIGRDYELAQAMSASPTLLIRDPNEDLNPDNTSGLYTGNVKCYREACMLAQWPLTGPGSTGNLINSGTWRGSRVDAYDPTFESYTLGATAPNWVENIRTGPGTISNAFAQQGTQSLAFDILTSGTGQGMRFGVPVIPGRQYTTSAYVRQGTANTMQIFLDGVTAVYDTMNRTTVAGQGAPNNSWLATAYTLSGGAAGDYSVAAGYATQVNAAVSTVHQSLIAGSFFDSEQFITITAPVLATGDSYVQGLVSRWIDANNYYRALIRFDSDGSMGILLVRRLAGVETTLIEVALPLTYAAGDRFNLRFSTRSNSLKAWMWPQARKESLLYTTGSTSDSSAALQATGAIGFTSYRYAANTNTNLPAKFSAYSATGSVGGTSTTTTAAFTRLAITYTADQLGRPAGLVLDQAARGGLGLNIRIQTVGATTATTLYVDALQHEQAAAASAFTGTGPVIYPQFRNLVERYIRGWRTRGFEGVLSAPCVDSLAALNKIKISTEYRNAVLGMQPDYYWPLNSSGTDAVGAELSGNAGPPLVPIESSLGAGTAISSGTSMDMPGDPGGTGVTFTSSPGSDGTFLSGTVLATGYATNNPAALGTPVVSNGAWAMTVAAWVVASSTQVNSAPVLFSADRYQSSSAQFRPIRMSTGGVSMRNNLPSGGEVFATSILDDSLHFVLVQVVQDATNTVFRTRVDSSEVESTVATSTFGFFPDRRADTFSVGGCWFTLGAKVFNELNGSIAHMSVWNRELTQAERNSLWSYGAMISMNVVGESVDERIIRHIIDGGYTGPLRIAPGSQQSLLGAPTYTGQIDLLTDSLNNAQADGGVFWVQRDGVPAFESRFDRWQRLTPAYTIGEDELADQKPYEVQPVFDHDPTYVFPVATWKRNAGATFRGGLPLDILTAEQAFFPREFGGDSDYLMDASAQDQANWIFYTHRAPMSRAEAVIINPWATPSLWPMCLSLEPGTRVRAVRVAKAANAAAGFAYSYDMFVEKITIPERNFAQGEESWRYELQLSPIGLTGQPTPMQPWVLGDSTWGVLDSTTVLGW